MYSKNLFPAAHVRPADNYSPIKAAWPQQCGIKHIRPVRSRHENDAFVRLEAIHLNQQLIQSLLPLVVTATEARASMTPDGVDLVDEDNARSILFALLKQVANPAGADADKHFYEIGTRDREEWNVGFACNRSSQQSFAGSRRSDKKHALGNASTQLLKLLRFAQEFDNLPQLFLGLIHAGHVLERDFLLLHRQQAGAALAEGQRLIAASLHLPDHEEPQCPQKN